MVDAPSAFRIEQVMSIALAFAQRLRADDPELANDQDSFLSALESETDATEMLVRVVRAAGEAEANADALDARIEGLKIRRERFQRRKDEARSAAFGMMDALGLQKFPHPEFLISILPGKPAVVIVDVAKIPKKFMRRPDPMPDKKAIGDVLKAGKAVAGAELSNSMPTLTIRTK